MSSVQVQQLPGLFVCQQFFHPLFFVRSDVLSSHLGPLDFFTFLKQNCFMLSEVFFRWRVLPGDADVESRTHTHTHTLAVNGC